ncbi:MAG TPA: NUDIX domain-containing protein [Chitinophagaceae bacterium]
MKLSAGILVYRIVNNQLEFLLVHPGGPFWSKKDLGVWSIPKGEYEEGEDPLQAARREFLEETGQEINGSFIPLSPIKLKSGKIVHAWVVQGAVDAAAIISNTFEMEWPPRSGKMTAFPEVDRAEWFDVVTAKEKINEKQVALIEEAVKIIKGIN